MDADEVIDNWSDIESAVSSDESDEREESEDSQESREESEDSGTDDEDTPDSWKEVTGNVHINAFCMHYLFITALHINIQPPYTVILHVYVYIHLTRCRMQYVLWFSLYNRYTLTTTYITPIHCCPWIEYWSPS